MKIINLRFAYFVIAILIICSGYGCTNVRYLTTPDSDVYLLADYETALSHWMMHDEIHDRFISLADVNAIFLSWEVRQAYLNTLSETTIPLESDLVRVRERQIKQFESGNEFMLALYCYNSDWYALTGQDPVWRLTLTTSEGITVRPTLIEEKPLRSDHAWSFLDSFSHRHKIYRVVFPQKTESGEQVLNTDASWFQLNCHSVLGTLDMRWELGTVPEELR